MRRRVIATHLEGWVDPATAFAAVCGRAGPAFWLDCGNDATVGMSCMGAATKVVTTSTGGGISEWPSGDVQELSLFEFLRREQAGGSAGESAIATADQVPFPLGWVGWLGYELSGETLGTVPSRVSRYPDAAFMLADRAVVFDHRERIVSLVALGEEWVGELASWRDHTIELLTKPASSSGSGVSRHDEKSVGVPAEWAHSEAEYRDLIERCQRSIRAGDAYQLCLTNRVSASVHPDPLQTYVRLRELSPSHHGGFIRVGDVSLLSSSPEKFLSITADRVIESKPIKGTRPRGATPHEDDSFREELLSSEKERAENLMIVDLVRNDFSRVCEAGSVGVPHLLNLESYAQVHQLVSTVRGRLAEGVSPVDAVMACFPAGSMTGAPKHSAVLILEQLERIPRGIYSGAFGYFGFDGSVDLAMVIRSIVIDGRGITIGTGGGITALSVPQEEVEETRVKAAALLRVLGLVI